MQSWQADNESWSDGRGVDQEPPGSPRGPFSVIRRFLTGRFRGGRASTDQGTSAAPEPLTSSLPRYVAAAPPPATFAAPLLDTRLAREVRYLLATLGASRGSVARALEGAGVRAAPNDPGGSPVERFLSVVVGADPNVKAVRVLPDAVVVELRAWWRPTVTVPLPAVVEDFKVAFDAGCYPALLREEYRTDGIDHLHGADADHSD